jgi:hypothetical protein
LHVAAPDFFQRIALVEGQISDLPQVPEDDIDTLVKVMRDNNTPKFLTHNGADAALVAEARRIIKRNALNIKKDAGEAKQSSALREFMDCIRGYLPIVELDAFYAVQPDGFVNLVRNSVDQYFDTDIYDRVESEHDGRVIRRMVRERVHFLDED